MAELIRVGFWRPKPPSMDSLFADAIRVANGSPPIRSFAQTIRSVINGGLPWPGDFVNPNWDARERRAVVAYLSNDGFRGVVYKGSSECRLCDKWNNGSADFSDGVYLWPEGYAHYVEAHCVRPPQEMVAHIVTELYQLADAQQAQPRR